MTTPRQFYFQITSASVIESITAHSLAVWLAAMVVTDGMAQPRNRY